MSVIISIIFVLNFSYLIKIVDVNVSKGFF